MNRKNMNLLILDSIDDRHRSNIIQIQQLCIAIEWSTTQWTSTGFRYPSLGAVGAKEVEALIGDGDLLFDWREADQTLL